MWRATTFGWLPNLNQYLGNKLLKLLIIWPSKLFIIKILILVIPWAHKYVSFIKREQSDAGKCQSRLTEKEVASGSNYSAAIFVSRKVQTKRTMKYVSYRLQKIVQVQQNPGRYSIRDRVSLFQVIQIHKIFF